MDYLTQSDNALSIASGAVTMALLDRLVFEGILLPRDAHKILQNAISDLENKQELTPVTEAIQIIRDRMLPRFNE